MTRLNFFKQRNHIDFNLQDLLRVDVSLRTQHAFVACAATIALVALISFVENRRVADAQLQANRAAQRVHAVDSRLTELRTVTALLSNLSSTARSVAVVRHDAHDRLAIISGIGDRMPDNVWLTAVTEDASGVDIRARATSTQAVGLAMVALDDHIVGEPHLLQTHLVTEHGTPYVEFEIGITPKGHS